MPLIGTRAAASAQGFSFTQIASAVDRLFEYVSLLLTGNGTNGAQNNTFLDSSSNNFTVTRNGNTTQGSFSPFGDTWSNYFDGSGDKLTTPPSSNLDLSSGDFTAEAWVYTTTVAAGDAFILFRGSSGNITAGTDLQFSIYRNESSLFVRPYQGATNYSINIGTILANNWYHVALTRSGNTFRGFLNGVVSGTTQTVTGALNNDAGWPGAVIGLGTIGGVDAAFAGYISNVRILKGTALYTANFIPPTSPLTAITNTSLLTCQSNRFIDNSTNNFAITVNGNTSVQKFSPFLPNPNTWSNYFDGTGDWINVPMSSITQFGSSDFTVEFWAYPSSLQNANPFTWGTNDQYYGTRILLLDTGNFQILLSTDGTNHTINSGSIGSYAINNWCHIALVRQSGTIRFFVNGSQIYSAAISGSLINGLYNRIGALTHPASPFPLTGYISNLRVVNGTAVYTTSFTPPTSPLTAITNTTLLTCQNSTIKDNSVNKLPLTVVGNTAPNTLSPFLGFSGYFDGVGDYLSVPDNAAFDLAAGDWTIETWFNLNVLPANAAIYTFASQWRSVSIISLAWFAYLYNNAGTYQLYFSYSTDGTNQTNLSVNVPSALQAGSWYHVAFVRSGNNFLVFLNGTQVGATQTLNATIFNSTADVWIGAQNGGSGPDYQLNGYLSNLRIVKGTAVYTANFTPPPVPVLPITNTSLLLNFANAGIQDVAMINDIETVGNAQVSTTQSKFGGASLSFDGTGDWLTLAPSPNFQFGTGDFTIEGWIYLNTTASAFPIVYNTDSASILGVGEYAFVFNPTLGLRFVLNSNGTSFQIDLNQGSTSGWSTSTWYHVALVRSGSTFTLYRNGVSLASNTTASATVGALLPIYIGGQPLDPLSGNGYIDELRITNGIARYSSNFNPPPAPFKTY